jgi:hypothetical protein
MLRMVGMEMLGFSFSLFSRCFKVLRAKRIKASEDKEVLSCK